MTGTGVGSALAPTWDRRPMASAAARTWATARTSAGVAVAVISAAVIHAAVVTDRPTPVTGVPVIPSAARQPESRGPKIAGLRGQCPCSRDPIEADRRPVPITGLPNIVRPRSRRLIVLRDWGWRDIRLRSRWGSLSHVGGRASHVWHVDGRNAPSVVPAHDGAEGLGNETQRHVGGRPDDKG